MVGSLSLALVEDPLLQELQQISNEDFVHREEKDNTNHSSKNAERMVELMP